MRFVTCARDCNLSSACMLVEDSNLSSEYGGVEECFQYVDSKISQSNIYLSKDSIRHSARDEDYCRCFALTPEHVENKCG